uniref:Class II major histocompatibility complex transactivator n=1 Tax=Neolamprologus brichardi TaxID=32507 RepID=A0A3Q4GYS0_NEOBR
MSTATPPRIFRVYPSQTSSAIPIQFITISDSAGNPVQLSPPPPLIRFPLPGSATTPTYILGELNTGMPRVNSVSCVLLCHSPAGSDICGSSGVTFLLTLQTRGVEHYGKKMKKSRRYILLLGNAGMGKTTLIKKLCIDWSRDCIPQFDFVFLLDGKKLSVTEPVYSLQTLLLNLSSSAPSCVDPEAVYAQILAAPKRVLIIFDGFDELRNYETLLQAQEKDLTASLQKDSKAKTFTVRQLYSAILQRVLLPGCTLLLSTRPRGTASQLLRRTDSLLEMCGFTPANVETYLSQYFSDPGLRESALESLKSMSYLNLLCWNPGLCRLVCLILEQSRSVDVLPRTLTGLCHQVLCLKMDKDGRSTPTHTELSSLAWEGVKANSSILPTGRDISGKVKAFGLRTGLFLSHQLRASPYRSFLQTLPFQSGGKGRRRPQREELELTQRFAVGLLFHNRTELQRFHTHTETAFRDMVANKQGLVTKHLEGLSYADLTPSQILEACHYVYEASFTYSDGGREAGRTRLGTHLAANLPEFLTFHGVQLSPPDVFTVQKALEQGGTEGRSFCLDLEDSGIQICGLQALVGLNNINTYRSCIADAITLWELLEQSDEESLLQRAVSKFTIHPLKAKQVCHIEHLEKLVNIHIHKSESHSILSEGVPAVKELHKLEFELGPDNGPLVLPKLWDLLPGLHNLQHLDLSQNCIGDEGVKTLAATLKDLPNLHCLSVYSNMISDEGAESLAAVLPHMASLTDLDVKFNKLTDVGAQSLGASLRNCTKVKTLRMWNQCIPFGVLERLIQQDSRILLH